MDETAEFDRIRGALSTAVERSSLRYIASQVGMSPTGLQQFMAGAKQPYGKTKGKVRAWFYREAALHALPPEDAVRFLRRFVVTLPEPDRAIARVVDAVESMYQDAGMYPPDWVSRVRSLVTP